MPDLGPAELNECGIACKAAGRYADGRAHYERALALLEREPRPDPDALATLYHNLGGIEHARGDYAAAESFARRGLALRQALPTADPPAVAADQVALAAILDGQGRYQESEPLYRAALRVLRRLAKTRTHDLAVALHDLGSMYVLRGRLARGRALLEEAAALKRQALGAHHPSLAVTLHNLAVTCRGFRPFSVFSYAGIRDSPTSRTSAPSPGGSHAAASADQPTPPRLRHAQGDPSRAPPDRAGDPHRVRSRRADGE